MKVKEKAASFCAKYGVMLTPGMRECKSDNLSMISERTVGAALRGRPAWNSISRHHNGSTARVARNSISATRRAATEGRPYSTFDRAWFISRVGR